MGSLTTLVERTRARLNQSVTNRPQTATFSGWNSDGTMHLVPAQGFAAFGGTFLVEIGSELIQATGFNSETNAAGVPEWGRAQQGTAEFAHVAPAKATINPLWPHWRIGEALIDGMRVMYPHLFTVKNYSFTTTPLDERYEMPADLEDILDIRIEWYGPTKPQRPIRRWSVDTSAEDGKRYLFMPLVGVGGRPVYISYRAKPVMPTGPGDTAWTWASSLFPVSAEDLPVLYAVSQLILDAEMAKTQTYSSEQSDRNRFVQGGTGNSVSRRLEEMFQRRLDEERRRLMDTHPPTVRQQFNR